MKKFHSAQELEQVSTDDLRELLQLFIEVILVMLMRRLPWSTKPPGILSLSRKNWQIRYIY